jgi:hypothetical protein
MHAGGQRKAPVSGARRQGEATRGVRVVSRASVRRIAGRMRMSRRARLDLPVVGNLSSTIFGPFYGRFGQVLWYGSSLKY